MKNNSSDFKGKDITVKQFLKRAQRVWSEGGRITETANAYAHAQDNIREANGGDEMDNFEAMSTTNFDQKSKFDSYTEWNSARGDGYDNIRNLNALQDASIAISAVANMLQGTTEDPTHGATQWRGGKNAMNLIEKYKNKKVPNKTLGADGNSYITNVTSITTKAGFHTFFNFVKSIESKPAEPVMPSPNLNKEFNNPKSIEGK